MTHYALTTSPFGNFAVSLWNHDAPRTLRAFHLTPIGSLTEIPTTTMHTGTLALDYDALTAEAHRQLEARGAAAHPYVNPRPEYTVNRAVYTSEPVLSEMEPYGEGTPYWSVGTAYSALDLTPSAQTKLAAWWESIVDEVVTPRFLAAAEMEDAAADLYWQGRKLEDARAAQRAAAAEYDAADARVEAATAAWMAL